MFEIYTATPKGAYPFSDGDKEKLANEIGRLEAKMTQAERERDDLKQRFEDCEVKACGDCADLKETKDRLKDPQDAEVGVIINRNRIGIMQRLEDGLKVCMGETIYFWIKSKVHSNVNPFGEKRYGIYIFKNRYFIVLILAFGVRDIRFLISEREK